MSSLISKLVGPSNGSANEPLTEFEELAVLENDQVVAVRVDIDCVFRLKIERM